MDLTHFTVKDIKITLRRGDGTIVVIEEACEPRDASTPKAEQAATPRAKSGATKPSAAGKKAPTASKAASEAPQAEPPRARASKAQPRKKDLSWKPHTEHGYSGVAASDGQGTFKVLKTKSGRWALFYDQVGVDSVALGCFTSQAEAVKEGERLHHTGMPDKRHIPNTCATADKPPPTSESPPTPTPKPEPPGASASDAELLKSFQDMAARMLDEDDT